MELYGPENGGWFRTAVMDWIALCEDLRDVDVRGYQVLRSLVGSRWVNPVRKLTLVELCRLVPSPSGGPSGLTRVRDLLRNLTRVGLVTTPGGDPLTTSSRRAGASKPLRIRINDHAPAGYSGWRNAADKLAHVQAEASTATVTRAPRPGRTSGPDRAPGRKYDLSGRKANPRGRKYDSQPRYDLRGRAPISPLSTASSLSCGTVGPTPPTAPPAEEHEVAIEMVLGAWASGAGRALPPESIRSCLAGQVPELLSEFSEIGELEVIARFAGERRWVDLGRAALHPECERALASVPRSGAPRDGPAERSALLDKAGVNAIDM
ncbi:hypothetical protein [Streptomyces lydicus]|uniref:hypothetical protein n=1 Tax=Streptomyces lydicus TaxID=47763 RepID=UPI0036E5FBA0